MSHFIKMLDDKNQGLDYAHGAPAEIEMEMNFRWCLVGCNVIKM